MVEFWDELRDIDIAKIRNKELSSDCSAINTPG
jgi:hypothetical protein